MTVDKRDRIAFLILCIAVVALMIVLSIIGAFSGKMARDTASYFAPLASNNPWGEWRHPLYGTVASWFGGSPTATGNVALAQGILHAIAALAIYAGARAGGIGSIGALCLGLAALFSQSGLFHFSFLLPESPAISFLLFAFAGTLAATRSEIAFRLLLVPIGLATGIAYIMRPSLLPAIVAVPALWYLLAVRSGLAGRASRAVLLVLAVALPFIVQSSLRWRSVGDFNIVSFGGFATSGMAGFMLTPNVVDRLPDAVRPTAQEVLAARTSAEDAGRIARTPLNSAGERSFVSAALGYFDIYARSYDDFVWFEIGKLRAPQESWVAFNQRLTTFSIATITAAPLRWLAWIGGATSRLVGRMIVTNAPMLIAVAALLVAAIIAFVQHTGLGPSAADLALVSAVALAWLASTGPLIVLITFPATRYIDTAAVLLAAVPALLAAAMIEAACARRAR
jgi:hypothetical protein